MIKAMRMDPNPCHPTVPCSSCPPLTRRKACMAPAVCLSIWQSICQPVCLSVCPSNCLLSWLYVCLSVSMTVRLSICLSLLDCLSCLSVSLSV